MLQMEDEHRSGGGASDGETRDGCTGLRRALEEEKALRRAEVAALWAAIHRLEARETSAVVPPPPAAGGPLVVPGLPRMPEPVLGAQGHSPDWWRAVAASVDMEDLFPKVVTDAEEDILAQLLGGGGTPSDGDGYQWGTPPTGEPACESDGMLIPPPAGTDPVTSGLDSGPEPGPAGESARVVEPGGAPTPPPLLIAAAGESAGTVESGGMLPPPSQPSAGGRRSTSEGGPGGTPAPPEEEAVGAPCRRLACLIVGDSMVGRGRFWSAEWVVETWIPPGRNISGCLRQWRAVIGAWERRTRQAGATPGLVVLWIGGNDTYPRFPEAGPSQGTAAEATLAAGVWSALRGAVGWAAGRCPVLVVGPTPRPLHDGSSLWETTAAYRLDRDMSRLVRGMDGVNFVAVGRKLCRRVRTPGPGPDQYYVEEAMFLDDRVHLTREGYRQVVTRLPGWLRVDGV